MAGWLYRTLFNDLAPATESICVKLCVRDCQVCYTWNNRPWSN